MKKTNLKSTTVTQQRTALRNRRAIVLIIVLVVVVLLSLSCYSFCGMMQSEYAGAKQMGRRIQSRNFVDSGVEWARLVLAQGESYWFDAGGIYDNPDLFQGVLVKQSEDPNETGLFTLIAPSLDDEGMQTGFRFGLTDESTRINLNILTLADEFQENGGRTILLSLPGMDEYTADAILDWIDADDDPREFGAEIGDYYSGLNPPYAPKNGQPDSVEELLLVRGVTPELMFGVDTNHNGIVDASESALAGDITDEAMLLGWSNYLTLYSKEHNVNRAGEPRIYLNNPNLDQVYNDLRSVFTDELSTFIVAYRLFGPYAGSADASGDIVTADDLDLSAEAAYPISQVLDIIDMKVEVDVAGEKTVIQSPVNTVTLGQYMSLIMDNLTTIESDVISGRININQAPRLVLLTIPGIEEEAVDEIIRVRDIELNDPDLTDNHRLHETWILMEGIVDLNMMRTLLPFVCAGGDVYRAEIVGYYQGGGASSRAAVVFDTTTTIPRLLFWRDKSHLPFGYDPETLGLAYNGE